MKIIQSCWSCNQPNLFESNAGWHAPEYHLMSWALSCLQLKKFHGKVALYADSVSATTLADILKLPYDQVYCELDHLNDLNAGLWALPKIYAYSKQDYPFLHVDGDVFIWKPFDHELLKGDLIAQNIEIATDYYEGILDSLERNLLFFPPEMIAERKRTDRIYAYNAGILGGHDLSFFKEYTTKAMEFVERNAPCFDRIHVTDFNVFYEQYLFYCLVKEQHKTVNLLLPEVRGGNEYLGFADFSEVPHNKSFLHLLGSFKRNKLVCEQMAYRLRLDYPDYYYRIIAVFKNKKLPLKRNYYEFNSETAEDLIQRHIFLKKKFLSNELNAINADRESRAFCKDRFLTELVKKAVRRVIAEQRPEIAFEPRHFKIYLQDVSEFENKVFTFLKEKFIGLSASYLYGRDIISTQYFEHIFSDPSLGYHTMLITDPLYEVLESNFDWSEIDTDDFGQMVLMEQLSLSPSRVLTAVIPECDVKGFRLLNIDELDIRILSLANNGITVYELLNEIKKDFDPADVEESEQEFEMLIIGRVKIALLHKLLKILIGDRQV
ncbi:MAG: DUF6734 family protein [Mucilaginibacter sp.]